VASHRPEPPHLGCGHSCAPDTPAGAWTGAGASVDNLWTETAGRKQTARFPPDRLDRTAGARCYERTFYYTARAKLGARGRGRGRAVATGAAWLVARSAGMGPADGRGAGPFFPITHGLSTKLGASTRCSARARSLPRLGSCGRLTTKSQARLTLERVSALELRASTFLKPVAYIHGSP
jgi:hypothetical protein